MTYKLPLVGLGIQSPTVFLIIKGLYYIEFQRVAYYFRSQLHLLFNLMKVKLLTISIFSYRYNLIHRSGCLISPLTTRIPIYFPFLLQLESTSKEECFSARHQFVPKQHR
jgi:hypothetical protein